MSNKNYRMKHTEHPPKHHWRRSLHYGLIKIAKVSALGVLLHSAVWAGNLGARNLGASSFPLTPSSSQPIATFSLEGIKFNDLNGNGVQDVDEKGIPFEDIIITNKDLEDKGLPVDSYRRTAPTDIHGRYKVDGLISGNYTVETSVGENFRQTAPIKAPEINEIAPYAFYLPITTEVNFGIWDGIERQPCTLCVVANDQQTDVVEGEEISVGGFVVDKLPDRGNLTIIVEAFGFSRVRVIPAEERSAERNIPAMLTVSFPQAGNYPVKVTATSDIGQVAENVGNIIVRDVATTEACDKNVPNVWSTHSGSWDDPTTWTGGQVPQANDWVMIRPYHEVKVAAVTTEQMMKKELPKVKGLCVDENAKVSHFFYKKWNIPSLGLESRGLPSGELQNPIREARRSNACTVSVTKIAKKLQPPGQWDDANTWDPSGVPQSTDRVRIPGDVKVIVPYSTVSTNVNKVASLCNEGTLMSPTELPPDNQQYWLAIDTRTVHNKGTINSSDGVNGGPGVGIYLGSTRECDNDGIIRSGNGAYPSGNGGPIRIKGNNITNNGSVQAGNGANCDRGLWDGKNQTRPNYCYNDGKAGNGGELLIQGTGKVTVNGQIIGGNGGNAYHTGGAELQGKASNIIINGKPENVTNGAKVNGQDGQWFWDPIILKIDGDLQIYSGDIYFVSDEEGKIEVGPLSEGAVTAERTLTWAIGQGGVIDFRQVNDKAFKAGQEVIIHADHILLPEGKTLEQLVDTPKLTVGPAKLLAKASWLSSQETIIGEPGEAVLLPLILDNLGPATDTYSLTMVSEQNWSLCQLPQTVTVNSQRRVELECKVVLPPTYDTENLLTITAISQSDPSIKVTSQLRLKTEEAPMPAACLIYGVQDQALNNSMFFSYDPSENNVKKLGEVCSGCDIESLAIHPLTNEIYVGSGDDAVGHPKGNLYKLDPAVGQLHSIGESGFSGISSLAFDSEGTLWSWAKGEGLVTLNPDTGQGQLKLPSALDLADLTWDANKKVLYGVVGQELWSYDPKTDGVNKVCGNLPVKTEAVEVLPPQLLPEGLVLLGAHQNEQLTLQIFDLTSCQQVTNLDMFIGYGDVEGLGMPVEACQ